MMKSSFVSIIVPVYNAAKYIEECVLSILNQTYRNIEVILVDDGSDDESIMICDRWQKKDNRVQVVHQKNTGVSGARNTGIEKSSGEWIVFLDSDDKMDPQAIENALLLAKKNSCDTVCWNCYIEKDGEVTKSPAIIPDYSIYEEDSRRSILIEALYYTKEESFYPGYMFRAVWGKLLSASIIKEYNIEFPIGQPLGEDAAFLVDYYNFCKKVLLVNQYWNYYKVLQSSAVRKCRNNLKDIQHLEFNFLSEKINTVNADRNTIMLNLCIYFDYQYIHHLYLTEKTSFSIFRKMKEYINQRNYKWKRFKDYDIKKIHNKSLPTAWAIVKNYEYVETLLCIIREIKHR